MRPRTSSTPRSSREDGGSILQAERTYHGPDPVFIGGPNLSTIHPAAGAATYISPHRGEMTSNPPATPERIAPCQGRRSTSEPHHAEMDVTVVPAGHNGPSTPAAPTLPADDERESEGEDQEDPNSDDYESAAQQNVTQHMAVAYGRRKGTKKKTPLFSVFIPSERMARDISLGCFETKDGRKTYIPEAGQTDHYVPDGWKDSLG